MADRLLWVNIFLLLDLYKLFKLFMPELYASLCSDTITMSEDTEMTSDIEKKVNVLVSELNILPEARSLLAQDLLARIQVYQAAAQVYHEQAVKKAVQAPVLEAEAAQTHAAPEQPATPIPPSDSADLVPITKNELIHITGRSEKLITRYIEQDGIKPFEILEMHAVAVRYGSDLPNVKNRLFDENVSVDDMDVILEARECLGDELSINFMVDMYKRLDEDPEQFQDVMQAVDENRHLSLNRRTGDMNMYSLIKKFVETYLDEGHRDTDLTIDILTSKSRGSRMADAAHFGYTFLNDDDP